MGWPTITAGGARIIQWSAKAREEGQQWTFVGGKLKNAHGLFLSTNENYDGLAGVCQWVETNEEGQKWQICKTSGGYFRIKNGHGYYLTVSENNANNGTDVCVALKDDSRRGQLWTGGAFA